MKTKFINLFVVLLLCVGAAIAYAQSFRVLEFDATGLADNDLVTWDNGNSKWIVEDPATAIGPNLAINDLSDVTITAAATDNIIRYNGSAWVNGDVSDVLDQGSIGDLSDVDATGWTTNDVLYWTGTAWDDQAPSALAANIALGDLSTVEYNDAPGMSTSCQGTCTWAPTTTQYAVNIGGWCFYMFGTSAGAAPSATTQYLIVEPTPWDFANYSPSGGLLCGSAYINNTTDGVREVGHAFSQDNLDDIVVYRETTANFISGKNYAVYFTCFSKCDTP